MVVYLGKATPASGSGGGSGAAVWGAITGTLANQTDLQNALNEKQASLSSDQITATNSGITSALVTQIGTNESAISTINGKIPSAASTENQLADKSFVNSSIATNTANFIGTYEDVATLEAYTGTVTNNDYAFVINSVVTDNGSDWATFADLDAYSKAQLTNFDYAWVINGAKFDLYRFDVISQTWGLRVANTDKASVTLNTAYNRYKATVSNSTVTWDYEYTLNNSSFTAVQWAAINSGANTTNIGQIATNTTNIGTLQSQAGNAVLTTTAQTLSGAINELDAAMPAAQVNSDWTAVSGVSAILNKPNLATVATSGSYTDLSNTPTIPTVNNSTINFTQGGVNKGSITLNQASGTTITLDDTIYSAGTGISITNNVISADSVTPSEVTLATVATSGSYSDLSNTPTIPTVNNATLTITQDGTTVGTFTANASSDVTIALTSGSSVDIDDSTITENAQNKIQAVGLVNKNTVSGSVSPLALWHGTQAQWEEGGEPITWYYWKTNDTTQSSTFSTLPSSANWYSVTYGDGRFVAVAFNSDKSAYSTDGGETWAESSLPSSGAWKSVAYGNGRFVTVAGILGKSAYSTDGGETWTGSSLPSSASYTSVAYGNGRFVAVANNSYASAYSTDGGETWQSGGSLLSQSSWMSVAYGNGRFVAVAYSSNVSVYSTDGGETWQSGGSLPSSAKWQSVTYGDGKFIAVAYGSDKFAYSTDGGETWAESSLPSSGNWNYVAYGNGIFVAEVEDSDKFAYSTDGGETWTNLTLPSSATYVSVAYGNGRFVTVAFSSKQSATFSITYDKCYTDTTEPTTSATVYSAPNTASALTITNVGTGTITLSDMNTYTYTSSGNQTTYDTVGNSYPSYLCFIDGVGVKIGNTTIANNLSVTVDQTYNASSTNAQSGVAVASGIATSLGTVETALSQI